MKILFLNSDYTGVAYWRMYEPARFINQTCRNMAVTYFPNEQAMEKTTREWERLATSHDLIVFGRISEVESLQTMLVMRELSRKPIVAELDDDFLNVDKQNVQYKFWKPGEECYMLSDKFVKMSDMLQLSTYPLKKLMYYQYGKKPCWVSPNLIDIEKMQIAYQKALPKRKKRDHIRIGWAGSATHYGDFLTILNAWGEIGKKYPKVQFVFRGMKADFFIEKEDSTQVRGTEIHRLKGCPIDPDRIELGDGVNFWGWPNLLAEMDIDIVIVPLMDSKFNQSKSNARYLEFSSLGIPGVYADVYPYAKTITHGVDGFLAKSTEDWVDCLSQLIESEELRRAMGEEAKKTVEDKHSLQNNIGIWVKNLEEMAETAASMPFQPYYQEAAANA